MTAPSTLTAPLPFLTRCSCLSTRTATDLGRGGPVFSPAAKETENWAQFPRPPRNLLAACSTA